MDKGQIRFSATPSNSKSYQNTLHAIRSRIPFRAGTSMMGAGVGGTFAIYSYSDAIAISYDGEVWFIADDNDVSNTTRRHIQVVYEATEGLVRLDLGEDQIVN